MTSMQLAGMASLGWESAAAVTATIGAFACLCAPLILWNRGRSAGLRAIVIAALGAAAIVLITGVAPDIDDRLAWLVEGFRNLAFLALIGVLLSAEGRHASLALLRPMLFALALAEAVQLPLMALTEWFDSPAQHALVMNVAVLIRLLFVVGMLVLIHNLFVGAEPEQRTRLGPIVTALALGWGFELNFHAFTYLAGEAPPAMLAVRGLAWGVVAVLLYRDARAQPERRFAPSRSVTFQSLSLLLIAFYLLGIFALETLLTAFDIDMGVASQFVAIVLTMLIGVLLASSGLRAMIREAITRNLFRHRFDYRAEWLRFSRLMGAHGGGAAPLGPRAIQTLAEIVDSPAGLLLCAGDDGDGEGNGDFTLAARWQWPDIDIPSAALPKATIADMEQAEDVLTLDALRGEAAAPIAASMPTWLLDEAKAWVLVPLLLDGRMEGAVVLARPAFARKLDWEDHDLLRIVGQQLAVHLSEQSAQRALLEAARFEEFNRRMAFVMHDIKNLASQLGLTVSNAEKHIENPAFRADMLVTLRNATGRMEALLARLSRYGAKGEGRSEALCPQDLAWQMFGAQSRIGPFGDRIRIERADGFTIQADREGLEQVLRHLVQNAIDASPPDAPVTIAFRREHDMAGIEIADHGCGMSAEFIRSQLFAPFVSTKASGFGIGAFEAREMIRAMKGRLEVPSREGEGSRFTIWLPLADGATAMPRKVA